MKPGAKYLTIEEKNMAKKREINRKREAQYDEYSHKLCFRIPKELYKIQKELASELGVSVTTLMISSMISMSPWDKNKVKKIVNYGEQKIHSILNYDNVVEGVLFDIRTGKWAIAVKFNPLRSKVSVKPQRYNNMEECVAEYYARLERIKREEALHKSEKSVNFETGLIDKYEEDTMYMGDVVDDGDIRDIRDINDIKDMRDEEEEDCDEGVNVLDEGAAVVYPDS